MTKMNINYYAYMPCYGVNNAYTMCTLVVFICLWVRVCDTGPLKSNNLISKLYL